ncbi:MAG: excinuclease ABC subunit UvrA [Planctomycetia bacterium]|nr:excinuclease ABC subunit UvrA [Planctomycetia bacterium]
MSGVGTDETDRTDEMDSSDKGRRSDESGQSEESDHPVGVGRIEVRGCEVHNLQCVDLDLPHHRLIVLCGVSGSGKSSLAMDTLYAEGQRRYIETFSARARQGLQRLEKPDVERIDGIPPAIAVTGLTDALSGDGGDGDHGGTNRKSGGASSWLPLSRATIATATGIHDYLRLLYARIGRRWCDCGALVERSSPGSIQRNLFRILPPGTRCLIAIPWSDECGEPRSPEDFGEEATDETADETSDRGANGIEVTTKELSEKAKRKTGKRSPGKSAANERFRSVPESETTDHDPEELARDRIAWCRRNGFPRMIVGDRTLHLAEPDATLIPVLAKELTNGRTPELIVDRLVTMNPEEDSPRFLESLETSLRFGDGHVFVYADIPEDRGPKDTGNTEPSEVPGNMENELRRIDGRTYTVKRFCDRPDCPRCGRTYGDLRPELFHFNSSLGACPECEGFGNRMEPDLDRIVPDRRRTLANGAIAPWTTTAYQRYAQRMLRAAPSLGIPTDVPFRDLTESQIQKLTEGDPSLDFTGLNGFFSSLEKRKYQTHISFFLNRWRGYRLCPACGGTRLRSESLNVYIGGHSEFQRDPTERNIAEILQMKVDEASEWFSREGPENWRGDVARHPLREIRSRLAFLQAVGLGYLTLDRTLRTLSGGEARRVRLTLTLGSSLVNMLYIVDEPSIGLHCKDVQRLTDVLRTLRDRGNTVIVSDHQELILRAADQLVEVGPGAGERGGQIVFQGTPEEIVRSTESLTGDYLAGRRGQTSGRRRPLVHGWLRLSGARGRNLRNLTVDFPLGVLCVVTGPGGSGKSTLIADTLYPALLEKRGVRDSVPPSLPYGELSGDRNFDEVIFIDQSPAIRSPRSNPATYLRIMDEIRAVFTETEEARARGFTPGHFSFNAGEGRCPTCNGDGRIVINMQFLPDVTMRCVACGGTRYRREVLEVPYRSRNIAEVLDLTAREAFTFFRGHPRVQSRLKQLMDVGLDYLRLGQPTDTLSGGELQRLRLATYISSARRNRSLFLMDEPTAGLHFADVVQLLDCFDALLAVGHSLILVDHHLRMIQAADYVIDLGPGAAELGGRIVATGTPEELVNSPESVTGPYLRPV